MTVTEESWDDVAPAIERFEDATPALSNERAVSGMAFVPQANGRAFHSEEAERHILACILLEGENGEAGNVLKKSREAGIGPESFYSPRNRLVFQICSRLDERKVSPSTITLVEELKNSRQLEAVGGMMYIMELTGNLPTTAHADYFIRKLRQEQANREEVQRAMTVIERAQKGEDVGEVEKAKKRAPLASKRVRIASAPSEPVTRLFLAGKPIATPGNLVTLISRAKTGKTATIGGAIAAIVAAHADRPDVDTLGFSAPHTKEAVVLIDTEQSPYDAFVCHQRALSRANEANDPDWLCHYALVGESAENLKDDLVEILAQAKAAHGGVFTIILDGVADFVQSVNDEAECNNFVTWLRSIAVNYDCPIICVIHSNEAQKSGDDGRGHLGKQLTRKAESNLLLRKEGDVTTITSEKQRKAPITESDNVAFRWSDQVGRHVSCASDKSSSDQSKGGRKPLYQLSKFIEFFPGPNDKHVPMPILWNKCRTIADIPRNTFRDLCEREFQTGELSRVIDKNTGPGYRLNPSPQ